MRGLILAAGRGSRINEITDKHPKCLIKIHDQTLLNMQLDAFNKSGINELGIITGYKREMLAEYGLKEFYNPSWNKTNMVSSLLCASDWLQYSPCIISYSDIFYKPNAIKSLLDTDDLISITYDPNWLTLWKKRFSDPLSDAETFQIDNDSNVLEIGNSPTNIKDIQGQYMGLVKFEPQGWGIFTKKFFSLSKSMIRKISMTEMLNLIIKENKIQICAIPYYEEWGEIDSMTDLIEFS